MNQALSTSNIILDPILPIPVVAVLGAVLLFLTLRVYLRVGTAIERWRNFTLLFFRVAGIALVLVLLLQPSRQEFLPAPTKEHVTLVAVDSSLSMKQRDVERASRFDAAKNLLAESETVTANGLLQSTSLRLFEFNNDAQPIEKSILDLEPQLHSTRSGECAERSWFGYSCRA